MSISDEAVEAAKAGIRAHAHIDLGAEHLIEGIARAALEAAAPHLMAEAWDEALEIVASEEREQWRRAEGNLPGAQIVAQRMQVIREVMRTRRQWSK